MFCGFQAEAMAARCGVDGAVRWGCHVPVLYKSKVEAPPMEWYRMTHISEMSFFNSVVLQQKELVFLLCSCCLVKKKAFL